MTSPPFYYLLHYLLRIFSHSWLISGANQNKNMIAKAVARRKNMGQEVSSYL